MVRSTTAALVAGLALASLAAGQDGLGEPPRASKERGLVFAAPEGWRAVEPDDPERAAWTVRPGGKGPRARVSLTRLAKKKPLDERAAAWARAFVDAAGKPLDPAAAQKEPVALEGVEGVTAALVTLRGTHVAPVEPGAEHTPRHEGWVALHAVLEGPDGTWVASVVGPAAVVDAVKPGLLLLVKGVRVGLVDVEPEPEDESPADEGHGGGD